MKDLNTMPVLVTLRGLETLPAENLLRQTVLTELPLNPTTEQQRNFHPEIVLCHPQIPPNTGTIVRLTAALCMRIHLIEPLGFELSEKSLRRAGLDYWEHAEVFCHKNWECFLKFRNNPTRRFVFIETGGTTSPFDFKFLPGDILVFGAETTGIPKEILNHHLKNDLNQLITLPMFHEKVRSLNLSNTVSVLAYLAIAKLRPSK
jgi:tRNA (cytidine/uridine-2'-O-)-methyltransferase